MLLLKNADILTMRRKGEYLKDQDVLIKEGKIVAIMKGISEEGKKVIDCSEKLLIPGMINAHLHSDENFFKGMFDNMPLEIWMLYSCPPLAYGPFSSEMIYLRTMLGALEMVKHGVTCVQDDVSECPQGTVEGYSAVFQAYTDMGIKANVGLNIGDRKYIDKIPYIREVFPEELIQKLNAQPEREQNLALYREIIKLWNGKAGHKVVVSTSAPQRCSDEYLLQAKGLAEEYDLPMHTHILESRIQYCTGAEFYGESIVKHANRIGFLSERLSVIHGVWMDEEDMKLLSEANATLICNPVSNLKLGSGIMNLLKMKENGVNVVLGTDGMSSNDGQNMFEAMKYAGLLQKVTDPDYRRWQDSYSLLEMVYTNASKSLMRSKEVGTIEMGKAADIVIMDKSNVNFIPQNNLENHLVYCENGESVETVLCNGKKIYEKGNILTVDEKDILRKINAKQGEFREKFERTVKENKALEKYLKIIYDRCAKEMDGMLCNLF